MDISDHLPIFVSISINKPLNRKTKILVRDNEKFESKQFLIDLEENMAKLPNIEQTSIKLSMNEFIQTFETTLQMHAPLKNITC